MQYGWIQAQLRDELIKKGKIRNLGNTYSQYASQNVRPTYTQLKSFVDKLQKEFKIRIVYLNNIKTLYSATLFLMEDKNER